MMLSLFFLAAAQLGAARVTFDGNATESNSVKLIKTFDKLCGGGVEKQFPMNYAFMDVKVLHEDCHLTNDVLIKFEGNKLKAWNPATKAPEVAGIMNPADATKTPSMPMTKGEFVSFEANGFTYTYPNAELKLAHFLGCPSHVTEAKGVVLKARIDSMEFRFFGNEKENRMQSFINLYKKISSCITLPISGMLSHGNQH